MKFKLGVVLFNEIYFNTQFENTLNNYTKPDISTRRFELSPVDRDKNGLQTIYKAVPCDDIRVLVIHMHGQI